MHIDYTVQIWKEDAQFVAHAMPLDVMSSGQTPEAARIARLRGSSPFSNYRRRQGYFRRNSSRNGLQIAKWKLGKS